MSRRGIALALVLCAALAGCGRKGPPLPPLRRAPPALGEVLARRSDGVIEVRVTVPSVTDENTQASIDRIEVYRVAGGATPPDTIVMRDPKNLKSVIAIRRPNPDQPTPKPGTPPDPKPGPGEIAIYKEPMPAIDPAVTQPAVHFVLSAMAGRARVWARVLTVPLGALPPVPAGVAVTYDETTMTVAWTAGAPGQLFRLYEVDPLQRTARGTSVSAAPLPAPEFKTPTEFGKQRCFVVRTVVAAGSAEVESDPAPATCVTPIDTFPPDAPGGLKANPDRGSVVLLWDPVPGAAGYIVLRSDGTNDTLQPLTLAPIAGTQFTDSTSKAGVRYLYAIAAVDSATPPNVSKPSATKEVVGR